VLAIVAAIAGVSAFIEHRRATALSRQKTYSGNLASAQRALGNDDFRRARRLLEELIPKFGEEDLRGFEWYALWRERFGDPHEVIREDGPAIDRLALSPDESLLAAHDRSSTLTLYDTSTLREERRIAGIQVFAGISRDGAWIVGRDASSALRRWKLSDGTMEHTPNAPAWLPISARGTAEVVAVSAQPLCVHIWNFSEGRETFAVKLADKSDDPSWQLFRWDCSKDGQSLVLACVQGRSSRAQFRISQIQLSEPRAIQHCEIGRVRPSAVGFDSRGAWAVLDTTGEVWRCNSDGWVKTDELLPIGTRKNLDLGDDNSVSRVASYDRRLEWQNRHAAQNTKLIARGHGAFIADFVPSTLHARLFSAATDGSIFCWPLNGPQIAPNSFHGWNSNAGKTAAVFGRDGKSIWVPLDGQSCVRLDIASLRPLAYAEKMLFPIAISDNKLFGVGVDAGLIVANPQTGSEIGTIAISNAALLSSNISANGHQIASIDGNGTLFASILTETTRVRGGIHSWVTSALNKSATRYWMTTSIDKRLECLTWPDGRTVWQEVLPSIAPYFILVPSEDRLVIALENGSLELRDAATGKLVKQVDSGSAAPQALALTPDGRRLFAGGLEGEIHCFDTQRWEEVHTLSLGTGERLHRLDCSPDGKTLVAFTKTGVLHIIRGQ
jgi:WD40 repeat protein